MNHFCCDALIINLLTFFESTWSFANSNFFIALISTFFAAFFGAFGAQRIIEKAKNKDTLLKEMHNANAAIMVAFGICNSFLGLKKQHIKSLKETFDQAKKDLEYFRNKQNKMPDRIGEVFEFQTDFQTITPLLTPTDVLQTLVFEKMSLKGRPLSLTITLTQTIYSLNDSLQNRNQLIDDYRVNSPIDENVLALIYFGLPNEKGHIYKNYPDTVDAIYTQTDNCIFFSNLLWQDLVAHGEYIQKKFIKEFGKKNAPIISKPDFTKAEQDGLMPDSKNYADWTNMFITKKNNPSFKNQMTSWFKTFYVGVRNE